MSEPRTEAGRLENDLRELRGAEPAEMARRLIERGWREAATPEPSDPDLLGDALQALELRLYGTVGPDHVPWFTHGGVSHGEDRPDCLTCQLVARLRAAIEGGPT